MGVVVSDAFVLILVVAGCVVASVIFSRKRDIAESQVEMRRNEEEKVVKEREARRFELGIELICLNCEAKFLGPLLDTGCPHCHVLTLVVTQDELAETADTGRK